MENAAVAKMDYAGMKIGIRENLTNAAESFFVIGYYLRQISTAKLYNNDGYTDIWDFARGEYGLSKSSASRFMAINERFTIDDGQSMNQKYIGMGSSKLQEMVTFSDEQLEQVTPEMTVKEIREIKKGTKTPEPVKRTASKKHGYNRKDVEQIRDSYQRELDMFTSVGIDDDRIRRTRILLDAVAMLEQSIAPRTKKKK